LQDKISWINKHQQANEIVQFIAFFDIHKLHTFIVSSANLLLGKTAALIVGE